MKNVFKVIHGLVLHGFAFYGMALLLAYYAVKLGITNVKGSFDEKSNTYEMVYKKQKEAVLGVGVSENSISNQIIELEKVKNEKIDYLCRLMELSFVMPYEVNVLSNMSKEEKTGKRVLLAYESRVEQSEKYEESVLKCKQDFLKKPFSESEIKTKVGNTESLSIFDWRHQKHWLDVKTAILKDSEKINKIASEVGVEARLIVSCLMVEQLRLFYSQREMYQRYFEPLKILANSNQISLGVMSIKEPTARAVENHLKDTSSNYYLGGDYENYLDYENGNGNSDLRARRLMSIDHEWNYKYGAVYLMQFIKGWEKAGYPIDKRPEIVATLFNVGFPQSKPNGNPKVGGSTVVINSKKYSFGTLAWEFYYSGEMVEEFPILP